MPTFPIETDHSNKRIILIVNDDTTIQILVNNSFQLHSDFELIFCNRGEQVLTLLAEVKPDLILLNINMSGFDGIETCGKIRSLPAGKRIPILIMTASGDFDSVNNAYQAGATDFITKPFNGSLLIHHIRYMLRVSTAIIEHEHNVQLQQVVAALSGLGVEKFDCLGSMLEQVLHIINHTCCAQEILETAIILDPAKTKYNNRKVFGQISLLNDVEDINQLDCKTLKPILLEQGYVCFPIHHNHEKTGLLILRPRDIGSKQPIFHSIAVKIGQLLDNLHAKLEQQLTASYFEHSLEGIAITDQNGYVVIVNKAFTQITGYSEDEVTGCNMNLLKSGRHDQTFYQNLWRTIIENGHWQGEIWNRHHNGHVYPQWLSIVRITQKTTTFFMAVFVDISRQKEQEQRIRQLAYFDELTGVANRALFRERLKLFCLESQQQFHSLALLLLDLDRFKLINDSLGHHYGDKLLVYISQKIQRILTEEHTLARLSSNEFVILLPKLQQSYPAALQQANGIAQLIHLILAQPINLSNNELSLSCSIGITLFPHDTLAANELLKLANLAMQESKKNGGNGTSVFQPKMLNKSLHRFNIESALRKAVRNEDFLLYYQPQLNATGSLVGAECLIRWHNEELGWVSPADFIPIAEETGLIKDIGRWVLITACDNLKNWQQQGLIRKDGFGYLAVNISPRQFNQYHFVEDIENTIKQSGLTDPSLLEFEITEHCLTQDIDKTVKTMNRLHSMGIRISIDDFGTGYSSLSYLKDFQLDTLKIDQSFIKECVSNEKHAGIVRAIIALTKTLNLNTIAEGVETEQQKQFLLNNDCQLFQGYYFSKPLPLAKFEQYLQAQSKPT